MTREELKEIFEVKEFRCMCDMVNYFKTCGFDYQIENDNWEDLDVHFFNKEDELEFFSQYDPWHDTWTVLIQDLGGPRVYNDFDVITLRE